jgi:xanthine dehydrogenase YagR molybdenum-binding subunit
MENYFFDNPEPYYLDRVDGKAKVTGAATYAYEYNIPNVAYGVIVGSTIAKGIITELDTKGAERAPGVLGVISHLNISKLPGYEPAKDADTLPLIRKGFKPFENNMVRFNGQPIAIVVADTFERAAYAASLVKAKYQKEEHHTDLHEEAKNAKPLEGNSYKDYVRGEADAWKTAPVKIEAEYEIPYEVHLPMEMHGITAVWEGPDKVTVYEKTQTLSAHREALRDIWDSRKQCSRYFEYVGGAFGSAGSTWPHSVAAVIAAKQLQRPIKLSLSRDQMFMMVGYRPKAIQKMAMGTSQDGKLLGITHEAIANTASYAEFRRALLIPHDRCMHAPM